jgi:hypothetical protein
MKLRFGPYKGRHLQDVPRDYLHWLLRQNWLGVSFRERVETTLVPDGVTCLGPRWFYLQRIRAAQSEEKILFSALEVN